MYQCHLLPHDFLVLLRQKVTSLTVILPGAVWPVNLGLITADECSSYLSHSGQPEIMEKMIYEFCRQRSADRLGRWWLEL